MQKNKQKSAKVEVFIDILLQWCLSEETIIKEEDNVERIGILRDLIEEFEVTMEEEEQFSNIKTAIGIVKQYIERKNLSSDTLENLFNTLFTSLQEYYTKHKDDIKNFYLNKIDDFKNNTFEGKDKNFKEFLYRSGSDICENWKQDKNEQLFKEEYSKELESFRRNIEKEFDEGGVLFDLNEDNINFISIFDRDYSLIISTDSVIDNNYLNNLLGGFKKFYDEKEAERFFNKIELDELRKQHQELQDKFAKKTEEDLSDRFKPISRKARKEDIYYTKLKWKWVYTWLIVAIGTSPILPLPSPQAMEILVWLLIRLPFVIVFWVGLAFISKRQREAHNEYIYFTHLLHLLNGMISTAIRSSDEVVRQEFIRAGMSHLASSPIEGLYGKGDKALQKAISKTNININKNL